MIINRGVKKTQTQKPRPNLSSFARFGSGRVRKSGRGRVKVLKIFGFFKNLDRAWPGPTWPQTQYKKKHCHFFYFGQNRYNVLKPCLSYWPLERDWKEKNSKNQSPSPLLALTSPPRLAWVSTSPLIIATSTIFYRVEKDIDLSPFQFIWGKWRKE